MSEASVGAFEAKTHLSKLLERAEKGESITITKHGRPVARLVPAPRGTIRPNPAVRFPPTDEELDAFMRRYDEHVARVRAAGAGLTPEEAVALVREHRDK
jgi:prevent-host-death family protein